MKKQWLFQVIKTNDCIGQTVRIIIFQVLPNWKRKSLVRGIISQSVCALLLASGENVQVELYNQGFLQWNCITTGSCSGKPQITLLPHNRKKT